MPPYTPVILWTATADCKIDNTHNRKVAQGGCVIQNFETKDGVDINVDGSHHHYTNQMDCANALRAAGSPIQLPMPACYVCNHTAGWVTALAVYPHHDDADWAAADARLSSVFG